MLAFDLVPQDYRRLLKTEQVLKACVIVWVMLAIAVGGAKTWLSVSMSATQQELDGMQKAFETLQAKRQETQQLQMQYAELEAKLRFQRYANGEIPTTRVFQIVDGSINGDVWLERLDFARQSKLSDKESETKASVSLPIPGIEGKTWQRTTVAKFTGSALHHGALAEFVSRLESNPSVAGVEITRNTVTSQDNRSIVRFEMSVTLREELPS